MCVCVWGGGGGAVDGTYSDEFFCYFRTKVYLVCTHLNCLKVAIPVSIGGKRTSDILNYNFSYHCVTGLLLLLYRVQKKKIIWKMILLFLHQNMSCRNSLELQSTVEIKVQGTV